MGNYEWLMDEGEGWQLIIYIGVYRGPHRSST